MAVDGNDCSRKALHHVADKSFRGCDGAGRELSQRDAVHGPRPIHSGTGFDDFMEHGGNRGKSPAKGNKI